jgi:hypothetical protein
MTDKLKWEQLSLSQQEKYLTHVRYLVDKGYLKDLKPDHIGKQAQKMYENELKGGLKEPTNGMGYRGKDDTKEIKTTEE